MVDTKKMVLRLSAGVGMDTAEFLLVPTNTTQEELDDYAWAEAVEWAQHFGLEPDTYRESHAEEEVDEDCFTSDIEGWFEVYDPKRHDGLRVGYDDTWREM